MFLSFTALPKYVTWPQNRNCSSDCFYSHVADSFSDPGYLVRPLPFLGAGACTYQGILIYEMDPHLYIFLVIFVLQDSSPFPPQSCKGGVHFNLSNSLESVGSSLAPSYKPELEPQLWFCSCLKYFDLPPLKERPGTRGAD